jgi:hypothetical protein
LCDNKLHSPFNADEKVEDVFYDEHADFCDRGDIGPEYQKRYILTELGGTGCEYVATIDFHGRKEQPPDSNQFTFPLRVLRANEGSVANCTDGGKNFDVKESKSNGPREYGGETFARFSTEVSLVQQPGKKWTMLRRDDLTPRLAGNHVALMLEQKAANDHPDVATNARMGAAYAAAIHFNWDGEEVEGILELKNQINLVSITIR